MRLQWGIYFAILAAPVIDASTIDVSAEASALVHTGDTLVFHLLTGNFATHAAALGLPEYPAEVNFALVSAPLDGAGEFAVTLESADGAVSAGFGDLSFGPGYFLGSGYGGGVSTLHGDLSLAPELSEELFSTESVVIALRNEGPDVTVGLAPYLLRQSLFAGLSGGPLSVGALNGPVVLEEPVYPLHMIKLGGTVRYSADSEVPEPSSSRLLLVGGVLLCGLSVVLARISRIGGTKLERLTEKSTVCIR